MLTTINAIEGSRPRFPADLHCKLAEMGVRRLVLPAPSRSGSNFLMEILPQVSFVDEGLTCLNESLQAYNTIQKKIDRFYTFYKSIKMNHQLKGLETLPSLQIAQRALNCLRTTFIDGICHDTPSERDVIKMLQVFPVDLNTLVLGTRAVATGIIHPIIDDSQEVRDEYLQGLAEMKQTNFNELLKTVPNYQKQLTATPDQSSIIEPVSNSQIWSLEYNGLSSFGQNFNSITPVVIDNLTQLFDQCLSLRLIKGMTEEVRVIVKSESQRIKKGWDLSITHMQLLLKVMGEFIAVQDATLHLIWTAFQEILNHGDDAALKTLFNASITQLLEEVNVNEQ